mmetsp:Transcript_25876/g.103430  ORF Transcript_25876/g.103430 Transcript_25876/m.103430 type:complete len:211 (-) Transcript_25876:423-1055(-)
MSGLWSTVSGSARYDTLAVGSARRVVVVVLKRAYGAVFWGVVPLVEEEDDDVDVGIVVVVVAAKGRSSSSSWPRRRRVCARPATYDALPSTALESPTCAVTKTPARNAQSTSVVPEKSTSKPRRGASTAIRRCSSSRIVASIAAAMPSTSPRRHSGRAKSASHSRVAIYVDTASPASPWPSSTAMVSVCVARSSRTMYASWFFLRGLYGA